MATILVALTGTTVAHFLSALLSVGLGWNFLYTAGSAMVRCHKLAQRQDISRCRRQVSSVVTCAPCACCMCTTQLVKSVPQRDRPKAQAVAETIQQVTNAIASVGSGVVIGKFGWQGVASMSTVPLLLCVVATVLTCYAEHDQQRSQQRATGSDGSFASTSSRSKRLLPIKSSGTFGYVSLKTAEEDDLDANSARNGNRSVL